MAAGSAVQVPAMQAPVWESVVLGAIQGLTEFLPISSDGHLALTEMLFKFSSKGLALNVMLHVGTLLATLVMLWPRVRPALFDGLAACVKPSLFVTVPGARDALVVILASIPTALLGLALRHAVERWTESPLAVGLGFLATSAVLIASRFAKDGDDEQPGVVGALLIGLAQGLAVLPGLSRSASTITLALFLGVRRERAFELSMLMSLPAVLGATLLEAPKAFSDPTLLVPAAVGAVVAFFVGLLALGLLRRIVVAGRFSWFAAWVVPVALATLALAKAWPHG
jgi:undecaprenyl-diphosphatase